MLTDILSRFTRMPVLEVKDGVHVEPNHVYVMPPGTTMTLVEGCLKLNQKGKSMRPIDAFLNSLAAERKTQAIGIVLSGTGTDGTRGLRAVRAEGGITFAQDPKSAQCAGMPQSAISAEAVDFILYPEKIAKELSRIAKHPQLVRAEDITEGKKTEEALAASEQKYRTIVETAAEGIVIAKPDGTHIFVNDRLAQMFGYSTEELLRKSSFELMTKEEQRRQALQVRKSLEKEQVLYSEFEFRRKDGSVLWAACNASPLFDENGKHVANLSMFSDITQRKKNEEALKKSEAEYSSLFANMIDGFAYCQMVFDNDRQAC